MLPQLTDWTVDRPEDEKCSVSPPASPDPYQYLPPSPYTVSASATIHSNLPVKCHTFNIPAEAAAIALNAEITNCKYIGSYNWVSDHSDVSIIVPGSPRQWQEQPLPYTVPLDILGHYRDHYDTRMRSAPLLPLLLAVNNWHERTHSQPSKFPWHTVDFITNRNSLRHLLRILRTDTTGNDGSPGTGARRGRKYRQGSFSNPFSKPFRIDIELAGNKTILLNRWEPTGTNSEPLNSNSYGFNFENAFTREAEAVSMLDEAGETARHHRINSYDFGGLCMVVRSEIDACIAPSETCLDDLSHEPPPETIASQLMSRPSTPTSFGLTIIHSQNPPTRQSHLVELSTAKSSPFPTWNAKERYPQLYFSQVPNHYLAYHVQGTIVDIHKRHLCKSPEMLFYAPIVEPKLRMLRKLLEMIQSAVITHASRSRGIQKSFSLVYLHGRLCLFARVGERCLPDEAFAMFEV